tara:strand:- start:81 stop:392 length:312 start_codon:yes stop_codon:yes gene_type:complete
MNYSQKANPNPTNSEMDSKIIIKPNKIRSLTSEQRDELIEQYVELVVDNMDTKYLIQYAIDGITEYVDKLTDSELKEEIDNHDEELYDELVDNVTHTFTSEDN